MKNHFKLSTLALALATTFTTPVFAEGLTLTAGEFLQNNDGTVTHTPTGLIWQACSVGQAWEGSTATCTGDVETYRIADTATLTSDFAGQTDWRIPNIAELHSLVDLKKNHPAVNKSLFPQTPTNNSFLSSTPSLYSDSYSWSVNFTSGSDDFDGSGYIRFVRGTTVSPILSLKDFADNGDGTVTHSKTGLTWQRCAVGQTWNDGSCDGKPTEYKHDKAIKLTASTGGKTDWRLSTYKELLTIVDYSARSPAANVIAFPDAPSVEFWTSTQMAGDNNTDYAWYVDFEYGKGGNSRKTSYDYAVRLVRGSMTAGATTPVVATGSVDLVSTLSANPSPAKMGGDLTYTATITNKGTATATGTTLTFYVAPRFMSYSTASNGCELKSSGLSVVCNVGDLAAGANVTKTMTVNLKKAGGISSSVLAKSNEKDANPADNIGRTATGVKK
jgi:hypothetical protein